MLVDPKKLIGLGRDISPPIEIPLADGVCGIAEIYRLLPGRRLVARGSYQSREVLVKLFFGKGAQRACARDKRGVTAMQASGVDTPRLLWEAETEQPGGFALGFEFLDRARPIATGDSPAVEKHAAQAVRALAQLHAQGVIHQDANLANFLVSNERLCVVDGAAVRQLASAASESMSLQALAAFLAQYPPAEDHRIPRLLRRYASEWGWPEDDGRLGRLQAALTVARRRRVRRYLAKTERACTEFRVEREWRRICLARRSRWREALAEFAQDPAAGLAHAQIIKNGGSATVFRLRLDGEQLVVKRYNVKSPLHRVRRWFKQRSRSAWRNGHRLAFLGIPGAQPIALIERRWGPLRAESWLVMPDCGILDIQAEVDSRGWSEALLDGVVRIFHDLKTAGLYHGDAKASNFPIQHGVVKVVDLDGMREYPGSALDVARFLENFEPNAQSELRARFAAAGLIGRDQ